MNTPTANRRRRHRRVADENRKRAPRACELCKSRKSKCIETPSGVCQRCLRKSLACRYNRERSPLINDESSTDPRTTLQDEVSSIVASSGMAETSPEGIFAMSNDPTQHAVWPRFLSKLREAFSLDSQPTSEGEDLMQASIRVPLLQPADMRRLRKAVDAFPPRPVAEFLLSVCIDHGTDNFFYFDQAQLLADIDEFYTDPTSSLRSDSTFVCMVHATLALGSQWTTLEKPESPKVSLIPDDGDPGRIFYNEARALIPDIMDRPSIRCVQAPFIIGVYLLPSSAIGSSYMYMGIALRKALALDLHQDTEDPLLSEKEKEIRRRVWWATYALERSVTVKLNRPRSISCGIITVSLPRPYPPLDSSQRFDNVQHQIANAKLVKILDKLGEPMEVTNPVAKCETDLKDWKHSLPPSFKIESLHPRDSSYRAVFHLYLNYYYAWIAMGKVSVVTVVRAHLRYRFGKEANPPEIETTVNDMSKSCVKAAKKMLRLFEEIKRTGNLTRFSFTDFQGCSTATIIILLAGILERDSGYEARVNLGLNCLRKMAGGNMTAKMGVSFVEALQSIANEAAEKLSSLQSHKEMNPIPQTDQSAEYNNWLEWLSKANSLQSSAVSPSRQGTPEGPPSLQTQNSSLWAMETHTTRALDSWSGATALQQLSAAQVATESTIMPIQDNLIHHSSNLEPFLFTNAAPFDDDQTYLMGLTGMDVLNFVE